MELPVFQFAAVSSYPGTKHHQKQLRSWSFSQPGKLTAVWVSLVSVTFQILQQLIKLYVGTCELCSHSQRLQLESVPHCYLGTRVHSGEKNIPSRTRAREISKQHDSVSVLLHMFEGTSRKTTITVLISSNKCLARQNSCSLYIFRLPSSCNVLSVLHIFC